MASRLFPPEVSAKERTGQGVHRLSFSSRYSDQACMGLQLLFMARSCSSPNSCDLITFKGFGAPIRSRERDNRHQRLRAATLRPMWHSARNANHGAGGQMKDGLSQLMITFARDDVEQLFTVGVRMQRVAFARGNCHHAQRLVSMFLFSHPPDDIIGAQFRIL